MLTGGLAMIGSVYDFFTLASQVREANFRQALLSNSVRRDINAQPMMRNVTEEFRSSREKEPVERVILRLAKAGNGIITASDLALAADISVEDARKDLDIMVSKGFAELRVRQSGALVYTIPDLMDKDEPLVD
jgi:Fic family protein